jgi:TIR domain
MALKVFISHSSKGAFASKVRDGVYQALQAKGFDVLLDRQRLEPGDQWRAKLHLWLATCDAAVILFSREAIGTKDKPGSDWVQKETTILTWRHALNNQLLIVPALLGDVTREETSLGILRPLQLGDWQFARAATADESDVNAQAVIDAISARFDGLAALKASTPELDQWMRRVATCLKKVETEDLEDAAAAMQIEAVDWKGAVDQQYATFACQLLFSPANALLAALPLLANSMPADQLERFSELVTPVWVSAEAAQSIVPPMREADDARRLVAINTQYPELAEHYLRRATYCKRGVYVVRATGVRGEDPAMVLAAFEQAFRRVLNVPSDRPISTLMKACSQQPEPWFALVGQGGLARDVLVKLRQYPKVTLVLVSGREFPDPLQLGLAALPTALPPLDADSEEQGDLFVSSAMTALGLRRNDTQGATE